SGVDRAHVLHGVKYRLAGQAFKADHVDSMRQDVGDAEHLPVTEQIADVFLAIIQSSGLEVFQGHLDAGVILVVPPVVGYDAVVAVHKSRGATRAQDVEHIGVHAPVYTTDNDIRRGRPCGLQTSQGTDDLSRTEG